MEVFLCLPDQSDFRTWLKYLQRLDATATRSHVRPDLHFVYVLVHINTTHTSFPLQDHHSHFHVFADQLSIGLFFSLFFFLFKQTKNVLVPER